MDTTLIISIITILITIIIGIPAFISLRNQAKSKIFFFEKQKISLYDDLLKNIPDLDITYKGKKIQKSMFLLKGIFIFSGKKDIEKKDIQKGIIVKVKGEDSKWYSYNIIDKTENLDIKISADESTLNIDFDLLTNKDYFVIEALGESDIQSLSYSHRIANVSKIETNKIGLIKSIKSTIFICLIPIFFFVSIFWIVKPFRVDPYILQPTFYDNSRNVVSKDSLIDTSNIDNSIPHNLSTEDSLIYRNILISQAKINFIAYKSDSISKIAADEYSQLELLFAGKTKQYRLHKNYLVNFTYKIELVNILLESFLIIIFLGVLIIFIGIIFYYIKYNKISKLAISLMKKH